MDEFKVGDEVTRNGFEGTWIVEALRIVNGERALVISHHEGRIAITVWAFDCKLIKKALPESFITW